MTEPTRCAVCSNYTLQGSTLLKLGLGNCRLMAKWEFPNPQMTRACKAFKQVPDAELPARIKWEQGQ